MRRWCTLLALLLTCFWLRPAAAEDGIPDNCEYITEHAQPNLFPRFEGGAVVLVDWTTGAVARTLEAGLPADPFALRGWSAECDYLAGAFGRFDTTLQQTVWETVVWDALHGGRVGSVPGAVGQAHPLTWGPDGYLVVESQQGALLWHVPSGARFTLTTAWDPIAVRNFTRLRWDHASRQLIANLVSGERNVYDLATGQEVDVAAQAAAATANDVLIGGNRYACGTSRYHSSAPQSGQVRGDGITGFAMGIEADLDLWYGQVRFTEAVDGYRSTESLAVLTEDPSYRRMWSHGFSQECRYLALSLGSTWRSATLVWDTRTWQVVARWDDARRAPHRLYWSPNPEYAVIETRRGAFLWHIPTDTRTQLTFQSAFQSYRYDSRIYSMFVLTWDLERSQMLAVTLDAPNAVTVYDMTSGAQLARYDIGERATPVEFALFENHDRMLIYTDDDSWDHRLPPGFAVWNRATGTGMRFTMSRDLRVAGTYRLELSPEGRYLVVQGYRVLDVWDLVAPTADGSANRRYVIDHSMSARFVSETVVELVRYETRERVRLDITSGTIVEVLPPDPSSAPQFAAPLTVTPVAETALNGVSGYTGRRRYYDYYDSGLRYGCRYTDGAFYQPVIARYLRESDQLVLADWRTGENIRAMSGSGSGIGISWSPDCHYISAEVSSAPQLPYDSSRIETDSASQSQDTTIVIWDALTGERVAEFYNEYRFHDRQLVLWSPGSDRAIVRVQSGYYLWNAAARSAVLLTFQPHTNRYRAAIADTQQVYWDYTRGQVLIAGIGGVFAFDMQSGVERYLFGGLSGCCYRYWDGGWSVEGEWLMIPYNDHVAVWNLDTYQGYVVDMGGWRTRAHPRDVALSPDGRLLAIATGGSIRIWDAQFLPVAVDDRDALLILRAAGQSMRFLDNTTLEVTGFDGTLTRWNVATGEQLP